MPNLTITIEDNSPLLTYDFKWNAGSAADDASASLYLESNFMRTNHGGALMTFQFNGTNVQVYGAKRGNHGRYQVAIDNGTFSTQSGNAPDPGVFQTLLFDSHSLQQGSHVLTLTNIDDQQWVDVDFVTWTSTFGDPNGSLALTTIDDSDSRFKFSGSDWSTSPLLVGRWFAGTGHVTTTNDAKATITFSVGDAISLYGLVNTTGSPYLIQMDSNTPVRYDAGRSEGFQTLLYHANNLGPGSHTLTFICQPLSQQTCGIDYAHVYSEAGSNSSGDATPTASAHASDNRLSAGDVVGIALGSLAIVIALGIVAFYLLLRRRDNKPQPPYDPIPFTRASPPGSHQHTDSMSATATYMRSPSSALIEQLQPQHMEQDQIGTFTQQSPSFQIPGWRRKPPLTPSYQSRT